jgi:arabinose-5-phosphate isomerase
VDALHERAGAGPAELLRIEAQALLEAADRLDPESFGRAVDLLSACAGKAILTGAGTSGIIARKMAATLTSTGTPAIFLHPSDALHGGLGAVTRDDVVIAVSNSGETGEILALLPYLRSRDVGLVAIVGNLDSNLARAADVVLDATAEREACPFNLAPTSSTTLALAVGDARAVLVLEVKGLTPEAFAVNHPSGRLGRRLTLRVADLMHGADRNPAVRPDASWLDVVTAISQGGLGAVAVLGDDGVLAGVVTDGDVRRMLQRVPTEGLREVVASTMMTANPVSVGPTLLAYDALQRMEDRPSQISVLAVIDDDGGYVGLIRVHDIIRAGV